MMSYTMTPNQNVIIPAGQHELQGILNVPKDATGIVLFAHGSGSGRLSPRNQAIARFLQDEKLGTLLFDLLTAQEEKIDIHTSEFRFDIPLLATRLAIATTWISSNPASQSLPIGYFGASTGAGAALLASGQNPDQTKAIVSRGGRPDLAGANALSNVKAATLMIVGGHDEPVIELNKQAQEKMQCVNQLIIIPGATHLFEEPGALDQVANLTREWFKKYLK